MKKVEVFDPALCCPTGVCGPTVDPELTRVAAAIFLLESKGFDIKRYNLTSDPGKFTENEAVLKILNEKGPEALPVVVVNNELVKVGSYPTNQELSKWFGIKEEELTQKPKAALTINLNQ